MGDAPRRTTSTLDRCPNCRYPLVKIREPRHHNLFFGFLAHCFKSWRPDLEFQPTSVEHLRAWLLWRCNICAPGVAFTFETWEDFELACELAKDEVKRLEARGDWAWFKVSQSMISVDCARSMAWCEMDEMEFKGVSEPVFDLLYAYGGFDVDAFKRGERAA